MREQNTKKPYRQPTVEDWGTVIDLTATGRTREGPDLKGGSGSSQGV
jgi:hypothetical protein